MTAMMIGNDAASLALRITAAAQAKIAEMGVTLLPTDGIDNEVRKMAESEIYDLMRRQQERVKQECVALGIDRPRNRAERRQVKARMRKRG